MILVLLDRIKYRHEQIKGRNNCQVCLFMSCTRDKKQTVTNKTPLWFSTKQIQNLLFFLDSSLVVDVNQEMCVSRVWLEVCDWNTKCFFSPHSWSAQKKAEQKKGRKRERGRERERQAVKKEEKEQRRNREDGDRVLWGKYTTSRLGRCMSVSHGFLRQEEV